MSIPTMVGGILERCSGSSCARLVRVGGSLCVLGPKQQCQHLGKVRRAQAFGTLGSCQVTCCCGFMACRKVMKPWERLALELEDSNSGSSWCRMRMTTRTIRRSPNFVYRCTRASREIRCYASKADFLRVLLVWETSCFLCIGLPFQLK